MIDTTTTTSVYPVFWIRVSTSTSTSATNNNYPAVTATEYGLDRPYGYRARPRWKRPPHRVDPWHMELHARPPIARVKGGAPPRAAPTARSRLAVASRDRCTPRAIAHVSVATMPKHPQHSNPPAHRAPVHANTPAPTEPTAPQLDGSPHNHSGRPSVGDKVNFNNDGKETRATVTAVHDDGHLDLQVIAVGATEMPTFSRVPPAQDASSPGWRPRVPLTSGEPGDTEEKAKERARIAAQQERDDRERIRTAPESSSGAAEAKDRAAIAAQQERDDRERGQSLNATGADQAKERSELASEQQKEDEAKTVR